MAKKETVIVFDGEDNFIAPKERTYDKEKGVSNFVGQDGSVSTPPTSDAPKLNPDGSVIGQLSPEAQRFTDYMTSQGTPVQIPTPSSPNFCVEIKTFIETRGNGRATSEMVMDAYNAFREFCVPKAEEVKPITTTTTTDTTTAKISLTEPSVTPDLKAPITSPVEVKLPSSISLSTPALGRPPMMGGGAGGGSGEEKKPEVKKKSNWLLWVLIGGAAIYYFTRKKN
jgi:hypothetical protein